jgi:hypothetical protein
MKAALPDLPDNALSELAWFDNQIAALGNFSPQR